MSLGTSGSIDDDDDLGRLGLLQGEWTRSQVRSVEESGLATQPCQLQCADLFPSLASTNHQCLSRRVGSSIVAGQRPGGPHPGRLQEGEQRAEEAEEPVLQGKAGERDPETGKGHFEQAPAGGGAAHQGAAAGGPEEPQG